MLFRILKLVGIDIPAGMAEVRIDLEERFDLAKDSVQQAAQTAAVVATLFFLASLAALAAFAVGLIALYSWVSSNYGQFYGLAAIGGVLLLIAFIAFAAALSKGNLWRDENARRVTAKRRDLARTHAQRVAAAAEALETPKTTPLPPPPQPSGATAASDLIEPLVWALSGTIKLPTMGNPTVDELLARLRSSAAGVADESVEALVRAVRYGGRPQVFAALGGAMFVGWLLGRQEAPHSTSFEAK
jgi:ABC-type multidrug transport system fused ATPase/permease subunit